MENQPTSLFRQDWYVDQDGYEIIEWPEPYRGSGPYVPMKYFMGRGGPFRDFPVFSDSHPIHRDFADVDDEDGAIAFCNKYGLLELVRPPDMPMGWKPSGDHAVNLSRSRRGIIGGLETSPVELFWEHHDRVRRAIDCLDGGLKIEAISIFNKAKVSVVAQIDYEQVRPRQNWHLVPQDLISAIWLLVEQEIADGKEWRRCKNCQDWFLPPTARAEYCKNPCKQAWHRKQRKGLDNGDK